MGKRCSLVERGEVCSEGASSDDERVCAVQELASNECDDPEEGDGGRDDDGDDEARRTAATGVVVVDGWGAGGHHRDRCDGRRGGATSAALGTATTSQTITVSLPAGPAKSALTCLVPIRAVPLLLITKPFPVPFSSDLHRGSEVQRGNRPR